HTVQEHDLPRSIADHAAELGADLIVLCTHGRGRLRHRLLCGGAPRVAARWRGPILLVPPGKVSAPAFRCRTMLVPLDGQAAHEQGLEPAAGLARAWRAAVHGLGVRAT